MKNEYPYIRFLLVGFSALSLGATCFSPAAHGWWPGRKTASALPAQKPAEDDMPLEINPGAEETLQKAQCTVDLDIPHALNANAICTAYAYPYPMAPPLRKQKIGPLSLNNGYIKKQIQSTAYTRRTVHTEYYPTGGWRWQNAYHRGLDRSGRMEPHLVTNLYLFSDAVFPYVKEECIASNKIEEKRLKRYDDMEQEYTDGRADAETEATRKGLTPSFVKFDKFSPDGKRRALVRVPSGQWWIVCTLKIPGLTYFWEEPVGVHEGTTEKVILNEDNALTIEGAW